MNRQIPISNLGFINSLSPSIKIISSITILGYLLSYSETAVLVSIQKWFSSSWNRFYSLKLLRALRSISRSLDVLTNSTPSFLGVICHTWKPSPIDLCNMDGIYVLLPRDSHLGSHHRHHLRDAVLKTHRAPLGSDSSYDVLWCSEFQCRSALVVLLLGTLCDYKEHGNSVWRENSWTHRLSRGALRRNYGYHAESSDRKNTIRKFHK